MEHTGQKKDSLIKSKSNQVEFIDTLDIERVFRGSIDSLKDTVDSSQSHWSLLRLKKHSRLFGGPVDSLEAQ